MLSDQGWIVRVLHWEREREGHERREGKRGILIRTAVGIIVLRSEGGGIGDLASGIGKAPFWKSVCWFSGIMMTMGYQ